MLATVVNTHNPTYGGTLVLGDGTSLTFVNGQAGPATITYADVVALTVMGFGVYTSDSPPLPYDPSIDAQVAPLINSAASSTSAALANSTTLRAAFVSPLPTVGSMAYNGDGTIASDPDGNTYTWNTDGTPATQTKSGVTRTYHWNTDGSLASVS